MKKGTEGINLSTCICPVNTVVSALVTDEYA